mmetsp:Transcript_47372/g.146138  ORF Transcript_47372/g.146138 Transcript_47372/m.146138 type:complete len:249 (+) Transcript_47372:899-1645(+)
MGQFSPSPACFGRLGAIRGGRVDRRRPGPQARLGFPFPRVDRPAARRRRVPRRRLDLGSAGDTPVQGGVGGRWPLRRQRRQARVHPRCAQAVLRRAGNAEPRAHQRPSASLRRHGGQHHRALPRRLRQAAAVRRHDHVHDELRAYPRRQRHVLVAPSSRHAQGGVPRVPAAAPRELPVARGGGSRPGVAAHLLPVRAPRRDVRRPARSWRSASRRSQRQRALALDLPLVHGGTGRGQHGRGFGRRWDG